MYIIKNAFRCIGRAKARNILIGLIVLVIAVSACLGLSIQQAAESAKAETLEDMSITATILFDRQAAMSQMGQGQTGGNGGQEGGRGQGGFNRNDFASLFGNSQSLTLEEYATYAQAESVQDFYYVLSSSLNGSDDFLPVSYESSSETTDTEEENTENGDAQNDNTEEGNTEEENNRGNGRPNNMGGFGQMMMGAQSDFSIEGFSSDAAMTSFFVDETAYVVDGVVFEENTAELHCIISEVLALYNNISVGDKVTFTNPNNEEETFEFTVVGTYVDEAAVDNSFSIMGSTSSDPDNKIYTSYAALQSIVAASKENSGTLTDENTGREYNTALSSSLTATYVFADTDDYYQFEKQARELGLADTYTVSSSDVTAYESGLVPLETLSTMAGYFLIVILVIGAVILVVLNAFNVRERKYEIGVLTAMGMKKGKVALQFLTEIFVVTLVAVIIGAVIGGVSSVPVTNALLENQVAAQNDRNEQIEQNFGRGDRGDMQMPDNFTSGENTGGNGYRGNNGNTSGNRFMGGNGNTNSGNSNWNSFAGLFGEDSAVTNYITEVDSAMNLTVVWQLLLIAVLLTLVSGAVSMLFVMRYDPLKILAERD